MKSGRTNDEVKAAPAATWMSNALWVGPTDDELEALDELPKSGGDWNLGEHTLAITNLDKVLIPVDGKRRAVTKRDLIRHYACMAPAMLPYVHDRPINLHRFPDGIDKRGFWHKARPDHAPDFVGRWRNADADPGETEVYAVLDNPAALAWAANFGAVELHPWTSTVDHPDRPTWALIDIDPGASTTFDDVVLLARLHHTALEQLGVSGCAKVTGQSRDPDLDPDRRSLHVRRHPRLGRDPVATRRRIRSGVGELGVDEVEAPRASTPRLHAERREQDARRTVQRASSPRRTRLGPDQLGRTR